MRRADADGGGGGGAMRPVILRRAAICQETDVNRYREYPGEKYRNLVENLRRRP